MEDFADYLRFLRRRGNFTQKSLAKALKISPSTITNWELGLVKRPRNREDILRLADILNLKEHETDRLLTSADYPIEFGSSETPDIFSLAENVPVQLPAPVSHFTGRDRETSQLMDAVKPGRVVTLCGPGGVGKTALATEVLHRLDATGVLTRRFPDGVLFHDFYAQPNVELAFEQIAISYGEEIRPTSRAAAQRALASRRALLFLDGAENADDLPTILGIRGNCGVLVTSQRRESAVDRRLDISPLSSYEARQLLEAWTTGGSENREAVDRICAFVGNLPLAVRLIGRYLNATGEAATEYLEWLEKKPIQALSPGAHRQDNVKRLLENSLARLNRAAVEALSLIGALSIAPFAASILIEAFQLTQIEVRRHLGELVDYGFLLREGEEYRVTHVLVHTFAKQQLEPSAATLEQLAQHFISLGNHYSHSRDHSVLDGLKPHVMALSASLEGHRLHELNVLLTYAMTRSNGEGYLQIRGFWNDEEVLLRRAISTCQGLVDDAELQWALHMAHLQLGLGQLHLHKDQYREAIRHFLVSSTSFEQIESHQAGLAKAMLGLGAAYFRIGSIDRALEAFSMCSRVPLY